MKNVTLLACLLLSMNMATAAGKTAIKKGSTKAKLGTSFRFDGTTLRGKYQTSLGTSATVEDDKYLDDLLGGRQNFKDRVEMEKQRN